MINTPHSRYRLQLTQGKLQPNQQQADIVAELQRLYTELTEPRSLWQRLTAQYPKGLYLWGSVGVGKTMLMDMLYQCLDQARCLRTHLHSFLLDIHQQLRKTQGTKNPLQAIAAKLGQQIQIIFFDEFYVKDVADAMMLGDLLQALMKAGVTFVATSNVAPDDLYLKGLQRDRFLPTIDFIKTHCVVYAIQLDTDYRRQVELLPSRYLMPHTKKTQQQLENIFAKLCDNEFIYDKKIKINDRSIYFIRKSLQCIWFDCTDLCSVPRSVADYLELARLFPCIMISNIPEFSVKSNDLALNFIKLIDVLYEKNTATIFSAATAVDQLYPEGSLKMEFERTQSRLIEMQSTHYQTRTEQ